MMLKQTMSNGTEHSGSNRPPATKSKTSPQERTSLTMRPSAPHLLDHVIQRELKAGLKVLVTGEGDGRLDSLVVIDRGSGGRGVLRHRNARGLHRRDEDQRSV